MRCRALWGRAIRTTTPPTHHGVDDALQRHDVVPVVAERRQGRSAQHTLQRIPPGATAARETVLCASAHSGPIRTRRLLPVSSSSFAHGRSAGRFLQHLPWVSPFGDPVGKRARVRRHLHTTRHTRALKEGPRMSRPVVQPFWQHPGAVDGRPPNPPHRPSATPPCCGAISSRRPPASDADKHNNQEQPYPAHASTIWRNC